MQKSIIIFLCFYSLNVTAQEEKVEQVYPFGKADKWGVISGDSEVIKKPKYDSIGFFSDMNRPGNSAVLKKNSKLGLINTKGKVIVKPKYDQFAIAGFHARDYQKVRKGDKWGLVSRISGKFILKPEYEKIEGFDGKENPAAVVKKDGKFGVFSLNKGFLTEIEFDEIFAYEDWATAAFELKKGDQVSFIDNQGKSYETLPMEEEMPAFSDQDVIEASAMDPSVEIVKLGDQKIAIIFLYDMNAPQGYKRYKDTIVGYDKVLKVNVASDRHFSDSNLPIFHVVVEKDGKKGMLGKNGEVMTPAEYDSFEKSKTSERFIYLIKGGLKGVANRYTGMRILEADFKEVKLNNNGLFFVVNQNGYFGYANSRGEVFLPKN